jgi:uncharacterized protein YjiS (DUF1127 family)
MTQTTIILTRYSRSLAERLWHQAVGGLQSFAIDAVSAQRLSRERDQLADLSDSALKDIGLTRADVWAELRKPMWRR